MPAQMWLSNVNVKKIKHLNPACLSGCVKKHFLVYTFTTLYIINSIVSSKLSNYLRWTRMEIKKNYNSQQPKQFYEWYFFTSIKCRAMHCGIVSRK